MTNEEIVRSAVNEWFNTVSEGDEDYSCNKCEMDFYLCPHLYERLIETITEHLEAQ